MAIYLRGTLNLGPVYLLWLLGHKLDLDRICMQLIEKNKSTEKQDPAIKRIVSGSE